MQVVVGTANWKSGRIEDPLHPLLFIVIIALAYCLWRWHSRFNPVKVGYGFCVLVLAVSRRSIAEYGCCFRWDLLVMAYAPPTNYYSDRLWFLWFRIVTCFW